MTETMIRVLNLMKDCGKNAHQLELATGLPNASIQSWTKGKKCKNGETRYMSPSTDAIIKLAQYFNVSADYLLCLTDEPTPLKQSNISKRPSYELSTELAELSQDKQFVESAKLYKAMASEYKKEVYAFILGVAVAHGLNVAQILGR